MDLGSVIQDSGFGGFAIEFGDLPFKVVVPILKMFKFRQVNGGHWCREGRQFPYGR